MVRVIKYCCFILLSSIVFTVNAQYLCENEFKIINKQKKIIKEKTKKLVANWLVQKADSLKIPKNLKLSKLKFLASEKETHKNNKYNKWYKIDSLFCIDKDPELTTKGKIMLIKLNLVVYNIRSTFNFENCANSAIKSELYFEFNFNGDLIRTVIRKKKMSPYSETDFH